MDFSFKRFALAAGATLPVLALSLVGAGCSAPACDPEVDDCPVDGGITVFDYCNDNPPTDPRCKLTLCAGTNLDAGFYVNLLDDGGVDQDWFSVQLPGTLTASSLLHVTAGYAAPATAVDLAVTVLTPDGKTSIARKIDDHGQKPPSPIDIIVPYGHSNDNLLILIGDKGGRLPPVYDVRNPYSIQVCVEDNPDMNEPNDTAATATNIPLAGSPAMGTATGTLATDNDVDFFKFDPGSPAGRNILYMHLTTAAMLMPPAPYRLSYTLFDPDMVPIAEGVTPTKFDKVDIGVAKLIKMSGTYTVQVQGYAADFGANVPIPGDLRQTYTVTVEVLPDLDTTEPNDNMAESSTHPTTIGVGSAQTFSGRLSYVPDPEWLAIDVPASGTPATMHAKFSVANGMGRFAPISQVLDRQMRIMAATPGATLGDSLQNCLMQPTQCPRGYDSNDQTQQGLVDEICQDYVDGGAAQCLWAERDEYSEIADLKNLEAIIPIAAHSGTLRYWVVVGDDGNNYADDLAWTVNVSVDADNDETVHGPTMTESDNINSTVNGVISYGYGRLTDHDPIKGQGIRGPNDYDAVPTDSDKFVFTLPGGTDTSWSLTWQLDHADGGRPPEKLAIDITFCDSANMCKGAGTLTYESGTISPWYSNDLTARTELYDLTMMASYDQVSLTPAACMCFEQKWATMQVTVNGTDRDYYAPMPYKLIQSTGAYPTTYSADGGTTSCPAPDAGTSGGCKLGN